MKKLLLLLALCGAMVACGGNEKKTNEANGYAEKSIKYLNMMLDAVENNDFIAFREAAYSMYVLDGETSDSEKQAAMSELKKYQASFEVRYEKHAYKFETWMNQAMDSFDAAGVDYYN